MEEFLANYGVPVSIVGDALFFLILAMIGVGLGLLIGRYRLVALLASVYFALAVFSTIPDRVVPSNPVYILLFFSLLVLFFTFLDEYFFDVNADISGSLWKSIFVGFFAVGAFVSVMAGIVGYDALSDILSKQTYAYLAGPWARFAWLVAPLIFFFVVRRWFR